MIRQTNGNDRHIRSASVEGLEPRLFLSAAKPHPGRSPVVHAAALKVSAVVSTGSISAQATSATSVQINWTGVARATGYNILRSTDGKKFTLFARAASGTTTSFSDTSVQGNHVYGYQVQALSGAKTTAVSKTVSVTTPLGAPSGLTGAYQGTSIQLKWTGNDASATGYLVFRSADGKTFSPLAKLTGAAVNSFTDTTITMGRTYDYEVEATTATKASAMSGVAAVAPPVTPDSISIATRFGNELVVTAAGAYDNVVLSQSGTTLTVTANGATFTNTLPAAGVFVYTRGGNDSIAIASSVTVRTTVDSIDSAFTVINSAGTNVSVWADSGDTVTGSGLIHSVAAFAGNVSKATGASLANPGDSGATTTVNLSLWGTGPLADDVKQGGVGDCYFLSTLAAFAGTNPGKLNEAAVDLGDGTYAVQFYNAQNKAVYVRVSNSFANGWFNGFAFAQPGAGNTVWAMVMEKAFAYFRTGANTYASTSSGWMGEAYTDLGVANTFFSPSSFTESSFYATVSADLANQKPVTLAALNAPDVVNNHAYTLVSASKDASGATHYRIRNPWGTSGDALEDSHGYATLTFAQLVANFAEGCAAA
jgi:fibronectin type 3 domain-containing protein